MERVQAFEYPTLETMTHCGSVWPAWMWRPAISIAFHLSDVLPQLFLIFPLFAQVGNSSPRRNLFPIIQLLISQVAIEGRWPPMLIQVSLASNHFFFSRSNSSPPSYFPSQAGRIHRSVTRHQPWSSLVNLGRGLAKQAWVSKGFQIFHMWRKAYRQNMIFCWQI